MTNRTDRQIIDDIIDGTRTYFLSDTFLGFEPNETFTQIARYYENYPCEVYSVNECINKDDDEIITTKKNK